MCTHATGDTLGSPGAAGTTCDMSTAYGMWTAYGGTEHMLWHARTGSVGKISARRSPLKRLCPAHACISRCSGYLHLQSN